MERIKKILWTIVWAIFPGYAPERTVSGIRIYVNGSGTTEIRDSKALLRVALEHFRRIDDK